MNLSYQTSKVCKKALEIDTQLNSSGFDYMKTRMQKDVADLKKLVEEILLSINSNKNH